MAFFNRTEIGLKDTSTTATVPNNPKAKLMYYVNCMCSVLKMDDDATINRFRQYHQYYQLSAQETNALIQICILLKPDMLLNKCIFQSDALCGNSSNKFYEIESVRNNLLVAGNIMIGGQNRQVTSIMTFKMAWLKENWSEPLETLLEQQRRAKLEQERQERLERQRQQRLQQERRDRQEQQQRWEREWQSRQYQKSSSCNIL